VYNYGVASRATEDAIDGLYQLPLDQFTSARNVLSKGAGVDAARIRALTKPPIAAWAVNQLYWRDRNTWDALIAAAEGARRTHKAVLSGRSGDVRAASKVHDDAVEVALKATLALLGKAGQPVTDATKQSVAVTLRALPSEEPPGRLTRTLQPGGFEALAGLAIAPGTGRPRPAAPPARTAAAKSKAEASAKVDAKALTRARTALASASRELREAEHTARRDEFEVARATRDEKRAAHTVTDARDALSRAKADLERAEADAAAATERRAVAEKRSTQANDALAAARSRADAAQADLKRVERG
jgi:hypothetical protein